MESTEIAVIQPEQSKKKVTFLLKPSTDMATIKSHPFSHHDNRHSIQLVGEYLGQGLGKRKIFSDSRNQHLSTDLISWRDNSHKPISGSQPTFLFREQEASRYIASADSIQPEMLKKFQVLSKSTFRRFPRRHYFPSKEHSKPSTQTSSWFGNNYVTPLHIIAVTQLPFAKKNSWNYSYKY